MKNFVSIVILLFFSLLNLSAQTNHKIDSLLSLVKLDKTDTNKINHLSDIAWEFQYSNPDSSYYYADIGLTLSKKLNFKKGIASMYRIFGIVNNIRGSYDKAMRFYLMSLKIYEETADKLGIAKCYRSIGILYQEQNTFEKALEYYNKSLIVFEELHDNKGIANGYICLGAVSDLLSEAEVNKGNKKQGEQESAKALKYYLKAMKICKVSGDLEGLAACYVDIGNYYMEQGKNFTALDNFLVALKISKTLNRKNGIIDCYINIGSCYGQIADSLVLTKAQKVKYLNKAAEYGLKTLDMAKEMKDIPDENLAASILKDAYKKLGNLNKAIQYSEIYIDTQDSLFEKKRLKLLLASKLIPERKKTT